MQRMFRDCNIGIAELLITERVKSPSSFAKREQSFREAAYAQAKGQTSQRGAVDAHTASYRISSMDAM